MISQNKIRIDGQSYEINSLGQHAIVLVERLKNTQTSIQEKQNLYSLLLRAKNGYIADLNAEIVQDRSGVDLSALFSDD
ncbi:DUF6447 family protein [Rhodobacteraceae bacterium]|nr:DUF6447 family protein [Paracoccaceae bacterium]